MEYYKDIFRKLGFPFHKGYKILDVGCGAFKDAQILKNHYKLIYYGIDIVNSNPTESKLFNFKKASIYKIPYPDKYFDYVYLHDVLHHIDEKFQRRDKFLRAFEELKRVTKINGKIIIIEGNRYNPLFYPHMVLMNHHNHWTQYYFITIIRGIFPEARFKFFECHFYPWAKSFWKIYEIVMDKYIPKKFLAYNCAIIKNL